MMDIIDPIFNLHKIKFDILDKWTLVDKTTDRVIVYINLDNVFKLIINPRTNNFIQAAASVQGYDDYMRLFSRAIVSNIINLGQHYRLWLAKHSIDSRIILYWNYPVPESYRNKKDIPTYRADYIEKHSMGMETSHILSAMKDAVDFCKECIQYVNEVYLVSSGEIEASMVPYILNESVYKKDGIPTRNFIVSNNPYEYSYVNYGFQILAPSIKKKAPYRVTRDNAIAVLKDRARVTTQLSTDSNFLELINAILGDHDRSIPSLSGVGIATILKMINVAIDQGIIGETTKDIDMLKLIMKSDYRDLLECNYRCTNLEYQYKDIEPLDVHRLTSQLVDNYDERTLMEMNERYFKLCPIDIIRPKSEQVLYDRNPYESSIFAKH